MKRLLAISLIAAGLATAAQAQTAPPSRIRGTIAAIDGNTLTVTTREGPVAKITLADNYAVAAPRKLSLADIKPNSYIGTAAVPAADGTLTALEVVVIPEASRGPAERSDLKPGLRVVVIAVKAADGSLTSARVLVEKDGVPPPI